MRRGILLILLFAVVALPAAGEPAPDPDLREAYYLARCAGSEWLDEELFESLMDSTDDTGRRALYLVNRVLALTQPIQQSPVVVDGPIVERNRTVHEWRFRTDEELGALGEDALPAWATAVRSSRQDERMAAALSSSAFASREDAVNLLIILLNDSSAQVRAKTSFFLGECETTDASRHAVPFLAARVLTDADRRVRRWSARSMRHLVGDEFPGSRTSHSAGAVAVAPQWIRQHYDLQELFPEEASGKSGE